MYCRQSPVRIKHIFKLHGQGESLNSSLISNNLSAIPHLYRLVFSVQNSGEFQVVALMKEEIRTEKNYFQENDSMKDVYKYPYFSIHAHLDGCWFLIQTNLMTIWSIKPVHVNWLRLPVHFFVAEHFELAVGKLLWSVLENKKVFLFFPNRLKAFKSKEPVFRKRWLSILFSGRPRPFKPAQFRMISTLSHAGFSCQEFLSIKQSRARSLTCDDYLHSRFSYESDCTTVLVLSLKLQWIEVLCALSFDPCTTRTENIDHEKISEIVLHLLRFIKILISYFLKAWRHHQPYCQVLNINSRKECRVWKNNLHISYWWDILESSIKMIIDEQA